MAGTSTKKKVKVKGHLEDIGGVYHMKLNWIDESGNRGRKSVSTQLPVKGNKGEAEEMLYMARKEQEDVLMNTTSDDGLMFADFMEQWLEIIRKEVKPNTFGGYQVNVQKAIVPYFQKKRILLWELTADDINDFYADQLKRVKAMTVHKYHANINKALKYAVEKDYIPVSVMNKVKRPKLDRFVGKFLKQSEVVQLFDAVKGHRLELGVILGAFYGLRRSEVIGLRWESINFEVNTITIEHTVTVTRIDGERVTIAGDTTKSKSSYRTLPLVPAIREKLLAIQAEQERNRKLCGKSYNKAEGHYIYTDALGNRIKPDYISGEFPKFMEKSGFRRIRFHDLRHSCASLLLANGVSLKEIQMWLGHSTFAITADTYAHLDYDSKIASAGAMTWIDNTSLGQIPKN
jgi:integrase